MARLTTTGYEWNDTSGAAGTTPDPGFGTGVTIDSSTVRSGSFAQKIDQTVLSGANSAFTSFTGSTTVTYFARAYVNFSSLGAPGGATTRKGILGDSTVLAGIALTNGVLQFQAPTAGLTGATFTPSTTVWYRLEFSYQSSSGAWEWRVDGATIATGTNTSASAPGSFRTGSYSSSGAGNLYIATFDDVGLNDDTGAAQTSWLGSGKIVLLRPISDNAVGTGWTNDAAGTTNLFDAVNNAPPIGIADTSSGTGLNQIRNATSNANVNYDSNLTTYLSAGVSSTATVNVLSPACATAAPVTTSAKQGTFGISSNPAITNIALSAAGTAGAFWQGNAASTYLSGWKWTFGTTTYAPAVTLGNSPVARITQVTSSTRIAMVCAMGMYVDYTPAADTKLVPVPTHLPFV